MTTIYGIPNCDTIKKARKWLEQNNIDYTFHDYRQDGLDASLLASFMEKLSWEELLNKRSTSFRNLEDDIKNNLNQQTATDAMLAQPTLIKRPVVITNEHAAVGFKADNFAKIFNT